MRGVILAGGNGTRLKPLTLVANKHLLPVYDRPMIYYPIQTLKALGCDEIVIVSGGEHIGGFADLLKDGKALGVEIIYRVQTEAGGIAQALSCARGLVKDVFPVILGDNYFSVAPKFINQPAIFTCDVENAQRFGVYHEGKIVEKPSAPLTNKAVTGLYIYDDAVFDFINQLAPSKRGELEITDVNNWYLQWGMKVLDYEGYWSDMGTFNSLLEAANYSREHSE